MKNKGIIAFLVVLALVIGAVFVAEFISTRPDRQEANPYALDTDSLRQVDPALILYRETRNLKLNLTMPRAISVTGNKIVVAGDDKVMIIDLNGQLLAEGFPGLEPRSIKATPERIYVGGAQKLAILDSAATLQESFENFTDSTLITSIDVNGGKIFAADAGKRLVWRLNERGEKEVEITGKRGDSSHHGFIIPSPYFDLAFNAFDELWIANTGMYSMENYTIDGKLNGYWEAPTSGLAGYTGCCNPAHFTFLPDGNFITSEKAITRIKEYKPSGELVGVVAPPSSFDIDGHAPDVASDSQGRIYALDIDRKMIRVFEKKQ